MRIAAFALVAALAACNPSAPSGQAGGGLFPDLSHAAYRAEAIAYNEEGQSIPVVMIRDGAKMRMEFNAEQGQMAVVNNGDTQESFALVTRNGQTMAMRGLQEAYSNPADEWGAELASTATRTGTCSVAGQTGAEWTRTENEVAKVACVTDDGIILRATEGDRTTWETTSVQRGAQDASLFVVPEGVQVVDMGAMMGQAAQAAPAINAQVCNALRNAGAPPERLSQAGC